MLKLRLHVVKKKNNKNKNKYKNKIIKKSLFTHKVFKNRHIQNTLFRNIFNNSPCSSGSTNFDSMARNTGNTEIDTNPNTTSAIKKIQGHSNYILNQMFLTISFSNEDVKIKHYILYKK